MNIRRTRIAAYAIVVEEDQILLCRLSARVKRHAGSWTLPGGGLDYGEDPEKAMIREVREETGLDVVSDELVGVDSVHSRWSSGEMHSIRIVFRARVVGGTLHNEVDESTDKAEWWHRDRLSEIRLVDLVETFIDRAFSSPQKA
ncbi:MAG: NUDIX hydrolase [Myxococcota bacterium]